MLSCSPLTPLQLHTEYGMPRKSVDPTPADIERGKAFAVWIRDAAGAANLTQGELAKASGLSRGSINNYFNDGVDSNTGKIRRPSEANIERIAIATGADLSQGRKAAGYAPRSEAPAEIHLIPDTPWVYKGRRYIPTAADVQAVSAVLDALGTRLEKQVEDVGLLPSVPDEKNDTAGR